MDQPAKISGSLRCAATGATIAMLPLAVITFLVFLKALKEPEESVERALIVIQFAGCLIWAGGLTGAVGAAKRLDIKSGALCLGIVGILLGGIFQMIFAFDETFQRTCLSFTHDFESKLIIILLITLCINLPIAIGAFMMSGRLSAMKKSGTAYLLLAFLPLIVFIIAKIFASNISSYSAFRNFMIFLSALPLVLSIVAVSGWWKAVSNARLIEEDNADEPDYLTAETTYVEQPATPAVPATPAAETPRPAQQQPQQTFAPRSASSITPEQKKLLMGMTDNELTNIINNPTLYANPAFVDEARRTLTKRQGWEAIKDFSDQQLLSVVHDNIQGFAPEVLDAASMELLARENQDFINEVSSLSIEELQGILANADNYYDGYIQLATRLLNQRVNYPGQQQ